MVRETNRHAEQQSVVRVGDHSKYYAERAIRITPQVLTFSNNDKRNSNQDRLFKLKPLLDLLKARSHGRSWACPSSSNEFIGRFLKDLIEP